MATIIMLTWNGLKYTKKCVESMLPGITQGSEIIFVDNGSTDGTQKYLKKLEKTITRRRIGFKIKFNEINLGFTKAINQGIELRKNKNDVILLNNDLDEFPENWLEKLKKEAYKLENCGVLGVKQYIYPEDKLSKTIMHYGAFTIPNFLGWPYNGGQTDLGQCNSPKKVDHVNFACAYIKNNVLECLFKNDGFYLDEKFFAYCDDDDFCLRTRLAGWNVWVTPDVSILHHTNISTTENKVNRDNMHSESIAIYKSKWEKYYEKQYEMELNFHSLIAYPTGYATAGRQIARHLDDIGVKIIYQFLYGTKYGEFPCPDMKLEWIRNRRIMKTGGIQLIFGQGDCAGKNSGDYKIIYTMLEVDNLPLEWIEQMNSCDEVWTPSNFNKQTFRNSGITKPIYVFPLGIDPDYFHSDRVPLQTKYKMPINFLSIGEWGERKNFLETIQAFKLAFAGVYADKVGLTIRYTNHDSGLRPPVIEQISKLPIIQEGPHVRFIKNDIQERKVVQEIESYQMGSLYTMCDAYILLTSGEGFSMCAIEALACGLPVITTGWSAHVEYLTDKDGNPLPGVHLVNYELVTPEKVKCPYYLSNSLWAKPDLQDAILKMRYVFNNLEEEKEKARATGSWIRENFSWRKTAEKMKKRLLEIASYSTA